MNVRKIYNVIGKQAVDARERHDTIMLIKYGQRMFAIKK